MPAKRIAAMGRSYRYPQADRRNCPPACCATARRRRRSGRSYKSPARLDIFAWRNRRAFFQAAQLKPNQNLSPP
jgi:hypothetical protein